MDVQQDSQKPETSDGDRDEAKIVDRPAQLEKAAARFIARLKNPPGRGDGDHISWTRDEIHERVKDL